MASPLTTRVVRREGGEVRVVRTLDLEVLAGPDLGAKGQLRRAVFRVGAHAGNDLVLRDETVSDEHLEIDAGPDGFRLADLGSKNGTFLGPIRLGEVTILDAVTLQLGGTTLQLRPRDDEAEIPASTLTQFGSVLGASVAMRELYAKLEPIAASDCSVLLEGETGTGKELIAESLHGESPRADGPFVVVDCGALAGGLIESELFGHQKGAFTGAHADRAGLLEAASGGTLFLDEIGELPLALQVKLLGALERRQVKRVGDARARPIDVRVIAATHRELAREVNAGRFRSDLFYRLAVVRLRVPPLRERLDDLPLLAGAFLLRLREQRGAEVPAELSALTLARLAAQPWPGNVRELRNAVERVALYADERTPETARETGFIAERDRFLADFDRRYLLGVLEKLDGNVTQAAHAAGLQRGYFQRLLRKNGISAKTVRGK